MNVVLIISDTFRRDHLGCYGSTKAKTPNLDKFAAQAYVFDQAYAASFPTVPNRWDILTGRNNYTYAGWQPLAPNEIVIGQVLAQQETISMMIADTPHILQNGFNYCRGFTAFEWIRGQENDRWQTDPEEVTFPCDPSKLRNPEFIVTQYLRNVARRKCEEDYFVARTMLYAADWLERNCERDFFLYVDTFDPHEPWDPPQKYIDMYISDYDGERVFYPNYAPCNYLTEDEMRYIRAAYAGECTMVDHWVGMLLDKIDELGLRENTAVIFTTDHGFLFGEHGLIGKSIIAGEYYETVPLYEEIAHIPLIIRLPGQTEGKRISGFVTSTDLMPTILEMAEVIETEVIGGKSTVQLLQCGFHQTEEWILDPKTLHGRSLMPLMRGEEDAAADMAITSFSLIHHTPRLAKSTITAGEWSLIYCGKSPDPSAEQRPPETLKSGTNPGDYQVGDSSPKLFHLPSDPEQKQNVIEDNKDIARELHARYVDYLRRCNTPEEHLALRLELDI